MKRRATLPELTTYSFKPGSSHEIEISTIAETYSKAATLVTSPHRADFHQIVWVRSGKAKWLLDMETIPMPTGTALFIRKHRVLMYDRAGRYEGLVIRFTDEIFSRSEADAAFLHGCKLFQVGPSAPTVLLGPGDAALTGLTDMMRQELAGSNDRFQRVVLRHLLHTFLIHCERRAKWPEPTSHHPKNAGTAARKFLDLIEKGFRVGKQVSDYAERLGITEKSLQTATAKAFGKSPKSLLDDRVILEAKRLLLFGPETVKEIAFDLGFDEVTNFTKYFRKHTQFTPASFRERYRG
jgi:AraC family transcriptional regulator, transcriptional activator of pobA